MPLVNKTCSHGEWAYALYGLCTITVMCAGVKSRGHVAMDYDIQVFT